MDDEAWLYGDAAGAEGEEEAATEAAQKVRISTRHRPWPLRFGRSKLLLLGAYEFCF